jgi:hypothetical protein
MMSRRTALSGFAVSALLPRAAMAAAFAQGLDPVRIPFTLTDTRVLVDCMVAGRGPFRFVLDTGGTIGLLDARFVRELGLRRIGESPLALRGVRDSYPVHEARELVFGGVVRQSSAAFAAVTDFNFGEGAVGSLAAGVLTAVNGELDYDAREWRIHSTPPARPGWNRFERAIVQYGNRNGSSFLFADAGLGGHSFRFGLDTGMPTPIRIYRRTAERAGLWNAPRWSPAPPDGRTRIVRASALSLAGATIARPLVSIMESPQWELFDVGLLGLPILRQFNMATEVGSEALLLKRNGQTGTAGAERYNRAGLWIARDGERLSVGVVGGGSPAEAAGLAPGDRLVGADFAALIAGFQGQPGAQVPLTIERAGTRRELVLTLADYL